MSNRSLRQRLSEPVDNTFLVGFRVAFGLLLLSSVLKDFRRGMIWSQYMEPRIHFTWPGFDWVAPLPGAGMYWVFSLQGIAALCFAFGMFYRHAAFVLCLGQTYLFLIDQTWYLNHAYLICLLFFLSIFMPANRSPSLDALWEPELRQTTVPRWVLWLLRFQVGIPYFFGGVAKINEDWLNGDPMRAWMADSTDFPFIGQYFTEEWCVYLFSWGGLILDLFALPLLLSRRGRWLILPPLILFHLINARLFNIGIFPWLMLAATILIYLPPETIGRLAFWRDSSSASRRTTESPPRLVPKPAMWLLGAYCFVQLCLPMRHWLYPSDVRLTREGHTFSWRMKLNQRITRINLSVRDSYGVELPVQLWQWLTIDQYRRFRNPDQILQLAHFIDESIEAESGKPVDVFGSASVQVNRRAPVSLIANANLSEIERTVFGHANWIDIKPVEPPSEHSLDQESPGGEGKQTDPANLGDPAQ